MTRMDYKLCEKTYGKEEIDAITKVLHSDKWTMGPCVEKFEREFCEKFGFNYAVMVNSGSSANLLAMTALCNKKRDKYLKAGDEVLVPAVCWSTSVYPILQNGLKPVFLDSKADTLNIDAEDIARHPNAKGIVLVHILGNSTDMDRAMKIANENGLVVLEDTCESLTSKFNGKHLGGFGDMGSFSFYFSHHMTTVEGGMVVCKNKKDCELLKCIRSHGWTRYMDDTQTDDFDNIDRKFCFVELGYNLRAMEFQGAMGSVQLDFIDRRNVIRGENYRNITRAIRSHHKNNNFVTIPRTTEGCDAQWFSIPLMLNYNLRHALSDYVKYLDDVGIENRPIVTGNFTRQPVMKQIDENIEPTKFVGADIIHFTGLYIGCPTHKVLEKDYVDRLADVLFGYKEFNKTIPFFSRPYKIEKAIPYVTDAINSTWISMDGKYINKCQELLKGITGCEYNILTLTGSAAIHCAVRCLKHRYPECRKVYVPNNTFMSCMNVLLHEFPQECIEVLDIDINTLNIEDIMSLEKDSALFAIHNVGSVTNIPKLKRQRPDIIILEDNSEGYLGSYEGEPTGSQGIVSTLSFNMNKNFTSGQGGAFCTNDKELYEYALSYTRQGFTGEKFHHEMIGNNLRMSNVTAALLLSQIEQADEILEDKKRMHAQYLKYIKDTNSELEIQEQSDGTESSYWNFAFRLRDNESYNSIEDKLKSHNIDTRPMFLPIQRFGHLKDIKHTPDSNSVKIHNEYFYLPFNNVSENTIKYIVDSVNKITR